MLRMASPVESTPIGGFVSKACVKPLQSVCGACPGPKSEVVAGAVDIAVKSKVGELVQSGPRALKGTCRWMYRVSKLSLFSGLGMSAHSCVSVSAMGAKGSEKAT